MLAHVCPGKHGLEALVQPEVEGIPEPFAVRRLARSGLSLHCVFELLESVNNPERVGNALLLDRIIFLPKAQDDIKAESLLYAFRDLVQGLIWLKVSHKTIGNVMQGSENAPAVVELICRSAQAQRHRVIFEGVESDNIFCKIVQLFQSDLYAPQTFLI